MNTLTNSTAITTAPRISVPDFYAAAPRAMAAVMSRLGPTSVRGPRTYDVKTISANGQTAAVDWKDDGSTIHVSLVLPALNLGAHLTRAQADKFGAYWVHELCHVWLTSDHAWSQACKGGNELRNLVNGLEDARIEGALVSSGHLPGALSMLTGLMDSLMDDPRGHILRLKDWGKRSRLPWTLAVMGRARLYGYSHADLPPVASLPVPVQAALDELVHARSTADCLAIAQKLVAAMGSMTHAPSPNQTGGKGKGKGQSSTGGQSEGSTSGPSEGEGQSEGSSEGTGKAPGTGAGKAQTLENDGEGLGPDISSGFRHAANELSAKIGAGDEYAAGVYRREMEGQSFPVRSMAAAHASTIADQNARLATSGTGPLRVALRNLLRAPEMRGTRRNQEFGRLDLRGLHRIEAGRADVFARKWKRDGIETAIGILIDASGSMSKRVRRSPTDVTTLSIIAADTALAIAEACTFAGAPVLCASYSEALDMILDTRFTLKTATGRGRMAAAAHFTDGSTPTEEASLKLARIMAETYPTMRKVMLVITDGQSDGGPDAVREITDLCLSKLGVETVAVGLGFDVTTQYGLGVELDPAADGMGAMLGVLARGLGKIRPTVKGIAA